jgi:hypothetical protein
MNMSVMYAKQKGNWKFHIHIKYQMTVCFGEWLDFDSVTYYSNLYLSHYRV